MEREQIDNLENYIKNNKNALSYKQICKISGLKYYSGGNSKLKQIKDLSKYFKIEKYNNKYVFCEKTGVDHQEINDDKRIKTLNDFSSTLYHSLFTQWQNDNSEHMKKATKDLFVDIGICNKRFLSLKKIYQLEQSFSTPSTIKKNYNYCDFHINENYTSEFYKIAEQYSKLGKKQKKFLLDYFYQKLYNTYKGNVIRAFNFLKSNNIIDFKKSLMFYYYIDIIDIYAFKSRDIFHNNNTDFNVHLLNKIDIPLNSIKEDDDDNEECYCGCVSETIDCIEINTDIIDKKIKYFKSGNHHYEDYKVYPCSYFNIYEITKIENASLNSSYQPETKLKIKSLVKDNIISKVNKDINSNEYIKNFKDFKLYMELFCNEFIIKEE